MQNVVLLGKKMQQTSIRISDETLESLKEIKDAFGFSSLDKTIQELILFVKVYVIKEGMKSG